MNYKIAFLFTLLIFLTMGCKDDNQHLDINLEELTVADIHTAFQAGTYTSEQLVQAYLDRIEKYDTELNAISFINPLALERAKELDLQFKETGVLLPLHGIPILIKDNMNTKGMPTTGGALALANFIPEEDAFIIQKLLDAGAILIAKTNMAEWAFSPMHTQSSTVGTTHNPYNVAYVPAGSSGGTAAGVAANFGTLGLGTDTGNSIRGPSSHCALVGFRATIGLVSREGIIPLYLRNDMAGPMCRTVEDATRVLEVIAAYDVKDEVTAKSIDKIPSNYQQFLQIDGLKNARIGVLRMLSQSDIDPEIELLFNTSLEDMKALGAIIIDSVEIPNFDELRRNQWCAEFKTDIETYLATYVKRDTMRSLEDIMRVGTNSEFAALRLENFLLNQGRSIHPEIICSDPFTDERRIAFREAIEKRMDKLGLDALVYPTWNHKPAHIIAFQEEYKGDNSQIIAPHTGQPAFTVPMGFVKEGLPAGLQFLGRMFDEPTLIKLSYSFEQGTQHRKVPNLAVNR